jgi:hypothetical protein
MTPQPAPEIDWDAADRNAKAIVRLGEILGVDTPRTRQALNISRAYLHQKEALRAMQEEKERLETLILEAFESQPRPLLIGLLPTARILAARKQAKEGR